MGKLRIAKDGIILEGSAEFIKTIKAKYIMSRGVSSAAIFYFAYVRCSFKLHHVLCVHVYMHAVLWKICLMKQKQQTDLISLLCLNVGGS